MRIMKTFKKLPAIIMVFAMLFGVLPMLNNGITAKASSNPVKLYSADHMYGRYSYKSHDIYIQVDARSAATKKVDVHYKSYNDVWLDAAATFVTKLDDNTEIWKATFKGNGLSGEYAIRYEGDGNTYWDNNNGNNYTSAYCLGEANIKAMRLKYQSAQNYTIQAAVKNLAYNKIVKVRYTEDNWATWHDVNLNYDSAIAGTNSEIWNVTLNLDSDKRASFHYCLCYEVNGQTYWDNNFGANYDFYFSNSY